MNLKLEAFNLCKEIIKSDERNEVLNIIKSLNKNGSGNSFGYYAGKMRMQFASFLQVEMKVDEVENSGSPLGIKHLTEEELQVFTQIHQEILYLNKLCLEDFDTDIVSALSPYSYNGHFHKINKVKFNYLPNESVNAVIKEFRDLDTLKELKASLELASKFKGFEKKNLNVAMAVFLNEFLQSNYDFVPPITGDLIHKNYSLLEYNIVMLNLTLCVVLHQVLNLNQLIFQAFINDSLASATENNIISIIGETHNILGEFTKLELQPLGMSEITTNPADICLMKFEQENRKVDTLGRVNSTSFNMSRDMGTVVTWDVSRVDDNLNSYPRLLSTFKTKRPQ